MIKIYTTLKSTSKIFFLILLYSFVAMAKFRSQEDSDITKDVLSRFGKECGLKVAIDEDLVRRLQIESGDARQSKIPEVQKCYENYYSQVVGVFHLYRKLCDEISLNKKEISQDVMIRQLLDVSKYQTGVRAFHSVLNDCLVDITERRGRPFLVPLAGTELDISALQKQIHEAQVHNPFPATIRPYR